MKSQSLWSYGANSPHMCSSGVGCKDEPLQVYLMPEEQARFPKTHTATAPVLRQ